MTTEIMGRGRPLTGGDLLLIFVAGVFGEIVLEFVAWVIFPYFVPKPPMMPVLPAWVTEMAPGAIGLPMRPHILVTDLGRSLTGGDMPVQLAVAIHLLLGFIVMPYLYVKGRALLGIRSWLAASLLWGTLLWLIAQSTLAPLAGRPMFLGFIAYSWGSLVAHNVYTVAVGFTLERLRARFPDLA